MKELNSCVGPISGEHLLSASVMQTLQGSGDFSISGVPWLEVGEERIVSSRSLRANCLCTKHNSALSRIDDAAHFLFRALKEYLESDTGVARHALISGHDLERWLLKTAKALAVSGNLAREQKRLSGAFTRTGDLIEMLDSPDRWPDTTGLYCLMNNGDMVINHPRFQLMPWTDEEDEIVALQVSILGLTFVLLLDFLDFVKYPMLASAEYRPHRINVRHPRSNSWITMSWQDSLQHRTINLQNLQTSTRA